MRRTVSGQDAIRSQVIDVLEEQEIDKGDRQRRLALRRRRRGLGHEVIVANARKVRLIGERRKKDDRLDAQTLARLDRMDSELLYPVKHRSVQAQADLTVIRARAALVRARTELVNSARSLARATESGCAAAMCAT